MQPDVLFFRAERRHMVKLDSVTRNRPGLAVEVLSPSTAATDRGKKMQLFARYSVPEYWIVDPGIEQIEVYTLVDAAYRLAQVALAGDTVRSVLLPGLIFDAAGNFTNR
ncbi:MAG: Uma2 family endonuclease [Vicinamibacterales bacterium]|nr:Uma2 family endonuclease [Vicinamibacterales bacterium]